MLSRCVDKEEIIDDLEFSNAVLIQNLNEMQLLNRRLGYNKTLINAINTIYEKQQNDFHTRNIRITDLGCGSGDSLRCIYDWMVNKNLNFDLVGIDGNAFAIDCARTMSSDYPCIKYQLMDILNLMNSANQYDLVILNNLCHHFNDSDIAEILKYLYKHTKMAIIINDIHRHPLAYFGIKFLTKILNFSYVTKHDAPLSVLRAFQKNDLINILKSAKIDNFEMQWTWPFRWQVIIGCNPIL